MCGPTWAICFLSNVKEVQQTFSFPLPCCLWQVLLQAASLFFSLYFVLQATLNSSAFKDLHLWFLPTVTPSWAAHCCLRKKKSPSFWSVAKDRSSLWLQRDQLPQGSLCSCSHFCRWHWAKHSGCQPDGICQGNAVKISKFCVMTMFFPLLCPKNLPPPS